MYKYTGLKGWHGSSGIHGVQPPTAFINSLPPTAESSGVDADDVGSTDELSDVAAPLPAGGCPGSRGDRLEDVEDEVPGNGGNSTGGGGSGGGSSRLFAKDKRKLREKRRSTGVVKYLSDTSSSHHVDDDEVPVHHDKTEDETVRNTSFNELTIATLELTETESASTMSSPLPATSSDINSNCSECPPCAAATEVVNQSSPPSTSHQDLTSSLHAPTPSAQFIPQVEKPTPDVHHGTIASPHGSTGLVVDHRHAAVASPAGCGQQRIAAPGSAADHPKPRPSLPLKPALRQGGTRSPKSGGSTATAAAAATAHPHQRPGVSTSHLSTTRDKVAAALEEEKQILLSKVLQLEKLLEEEKQANSSLRDQLRSRDSRIADLEEEVEALNKDLDLADDDYEKLEEENRVLMRAVSQLTSQ